MDIRIGNRKYESTRVASAVLDIPYATMVKKVSESKGDFDKLTKMIVDYFKVGLDGKYYKSFAQASLVAGVPATFLQNYVSKYGKDVSTEELLASYNPKGSKYSAGYTICGKEYNTLALASIDLKVPSTWLYRSYALYGESEDLDDAVEGYGKNGRGTKIILQGKEYPSIASLAQEYGVTDVFVHQVLDDFKDDNDRVEMLERNRQEYFCIHNTYVKTPTRIARELGIPVKNVPNAIEDYRKGMTWKKISKKYKANKRKVYGPIVVYGVAVPSLLRITKITGIRRGLVKEYYEQSETTKDFEDQLNERGQKMFGENFTKVEGYANIFEKAFKEGKVYTECL